MATKNTEASEALKQLTYLASALKAPRITEAAGQAGRRRPRCRVGPREVPRRGHSDAPNRAWPRVGHNSHDDGPSCCRHLDHCRRLEGRPF
jgi:hypothetical protein